MLRPKYEFIYTSALSYVEDRAIDQLIKLAKKEDKTDTEASEVARLLEYMPEVTQVRITVAQCTGLMSTRYNRLTVDARHFFIEQSGLEMPFEGELSVEQNDIRNMAFDAAAAIAATEKFEQRTTKPVVTADGIDYENTEWIVGVPEEFKTIAGFMTECPNTLRDVWVGRAYDANPNLWRRSTDETAKNFGAVSEKELTKR
jgi:hypothetical protein